MSIKDLFKSIDSLVYGDDHNNKPEKYPKWKNRPEYPKLIDGAEMTQKHIIDSEKRDVMMYIDTNIVDELKKYMDINNKIINDEEDYECCVCLESYKKSDLVYATCKHSLCNGCFKKVHKKECPICKIALKGFYYDGKYAIVCLGEPTKMHTFENGGYASIKVLFLPELEEQRYKIYRTITYRDEDPEKTQFVADLIDMSNKGYRIVVQDFKKTKKWFNEIMIYDILNALDPIEY